MRRLIGTLMLVGVASCAGFSAIDRGEFRRVYAEGVTKNTPDAAQVIITRDAYEEEVAGGTRRAWEAPPGFTPAFLRQTPSIGLRVGEILELRVDENEPAELLLQGAVVEPFWNPVVKRDQWKDGQDVTQRESTLYLRGKKAGTGVLRVVRGADSTDIPITVTQ